MSANGYKMKQNVELSPYQKKIEEIDNVILCVAEAERMVAQIGASLVSDLDAPRTRVDIYLRRRKFTWSGRSKE
jgi:hypothetical protein